METHTYSEGWPELWGKICKKGVKGEKRTTVEINAVEIIVG